MSDVNQAVSDYYEWKEKQKSAGDFGVVIRGAGEKQSYYNNGKSYNKPTSLSRETGYKSFPVTSIDGKDQKAFFEKNSKGSYDLFIGEGNTQKVKGSTANIFKGSKVYDKEEYTFKGEFKNPAEIENWLRNNDRMNYKRGKWTEFGVTDPLEKRARALKAFGTAHLVRDADGNVIFGDEKKWDAFEAKVEKEKKDYIKQFQDKFGGFGGQLFLLENIRQLVLKSAEDNVRGGGWRKRPTKPPKSSPSNPKSTAPVFGLKALSCDNPESLFHFMITNTAKQLIAFQNGTPEMFSALIPQVRLYFIYPNGDEALIPFSMYKESLEYGDPTKLLQDRQSRGDDVGLLSLDWNFEGGKTGLVFADGGGTGTANLKLFFENAASVTETRVVTRSNGDQTTKGLFSYDQLLSQGVVDHNNNEIQFTDRGRLRAIIKYGVDESFSKVIPNSSSFFKAAKEMAIVLSLAPSQYELEFNDSGGLTMGIEYKHTVEVNIQDPKLNIFGGKLEIAKKEYEEKKAEINYLLDNGMSRIDAQSTPDQPVPFVDATEVDERLQEIEDDFLVAQNEVYGNVKQKILQKVYKKNFDLGTLQNYLTVRQIQLAERKKIAASIGGAHLWDSKSSFARDGMVFAKFEEAGSGRPLEGRIEFLGDQDIYWVYFGDIIDALLQQENVQDKMKKENISIVLGQLVIPETMKGVNGKEPPTSVAFNLADLPIALDVWNQFFTENVVKPKVVNIDFFAFVRKMIASLIHPMLNNPDIVGKGDFPRTSKVQINFYTGDKEKISNLFMGSNRKFVDNITDAYLGSPIDLEPMNKDRKANVCFIGGGFDSNLIGMDGLKGDEKTDQRLGIMHYYLARDRGFVQSAQFVKSSVPRSREINVAESLSTVQNVAPRTAFWDPYNVNIEMYGNPNVLFGNIFFVQPTLPGIGAFTDEGSVAYKLQIGGYHAATEITNTVTPQGWSTSVVGLRQDPISGDLAGKEIKNNKNLYPKGRVTLSDKKSSETGNILS